MPRLCSQYALCWALYKPIENTLFLFQRAYPMNALIPLDGLCIISLFLGVFLHTKKILLTWLNLRIAWDILEQDYICCKLLKRLCGFMQIRSSWDCPRSTGGSSVFLPALGPHISYYAFPSCFKVIASDKTMPVFFTLAKSLLRATDMAQIHPCARLQISLRGLFLL